LDVIHLKQVYPSKEGYTFLIKKSGEGIHGRGRTVMNLGHLTGAKHQTSKLLFRLLIGDIQMQIQLCNLIVGVDTAGAILTGMRDIDAHIKVSIKSLFHVRSPSGLTGFPSLFSLMIIRLPMGFVKF